MPNPSETKASDINTELGKTSTSLLNMNDANTRNLAVKSSGAIKYGDCRWGINFPAREISVFSVDTVYDTDDRLLGEDNATGIFGVDTELYARVGMNFYSNGVFRLFCERDANGYNVGFQHFHRTWLTSGNNTDYTVQLQVSTGSWTSGDATGTDLAMSTTRQYQLQAYVAGPAGSDLGKAVTGNVIIKSSGTELFRRPYSFGVSAEIPI